MLLQFFILSLASVVTLSCDAGCLNCTQIYIFSICSQCRPLHYLDIYGSCQCVAGYYSGVAANESPSQCYSCSVGCLICISSVNCLMCNSSSYRMLVNGSCPCIYSSNASGDCPSQPPTQINVGFVVGGSIGGFLFMACCFASVVYIMKHRKNSIIDHGADARQIGDLRHSDQVFVSRSQDNESGLDLHKDRVFKEDVCSICLDSQALFMTSCGHYFHQKCIFSWLTKRQACPNCNTIVSPKLICCWCCRCKNQIILPHRKIQQKAKEKEVLTLAYDLQCPNCQQIEQIINL